MKSFQKNKNAKITKPNPDDNQYWILTILGTNRESTTLKGHNFTTMLVHSRKTTQFQNIPVSQQKKNKIYQTPILLYTKVIQEPSHKKKKNKIKHLYASKFQNNQNPKKIKKNLNLLKLKNHMERESKIHEAMEKQWISFFLFFWVTSEIKKRVSLEADYLFVALLS